MHTRRMDDQVGHDLIDTTVQIFRGIDGGADVLREFVADVGYTTEDGPESIGQVQGWIGWSIHSEDLADAGDAISVDAERLGATAHDIIDTHYEKFIDAALLIDRMHLDEEWRGNRLSQAIIDDLLSLLRLDPEATVVVLQPEPQDSDGGPLDDGPERDQAMSKLQAAYRGSGFVPWAGSDVWWRPF